MSRSDPFHVSELKRVVASWRCGLETRVRELIAGSAIPEAAAGPVLRTRPGSRRELASLEKLLRGPASEYSVCRPLNTIPGVGHDHGADSQVRTRRPQSRCENRKMFAPRSSRRRDRSGRRFLARLRERQECGRAHDPSAVRTRRRDPRCVQWPVRVRSQGKAGVCVSSGVSWAGGTVPNRQNGRGIDGDRERGHGSAAARNRS